MRWPWQSKPEIETRSSAYDDEIITQILARANGISARLPTATAALEACAGVVSRAFAVAEVEGPSWARDALSPACLSMIGRALIRRGEILFAIDAEDGALKLWPAADHDIDGGYDPDTWSYRLNLAGPSEQVTRGGLRSESVIFLRYSVDADRPWISRGPIQSAAIAGRLSAETMTALADELAGPRGYLLPLPNTDGKDGSIAGLKADLKTLSGTIATVESMSTSWGTGDRRTAPSAEWEPRRVGARPPDAIVNLAELATKEILSACGISPALFDPRAAAAAREAYRQLLFSVVAPLGKLVSAELSVKLEAPIVLKWAELRAADIMGRARAYQSLVGAGMDKARAETLSGLAS